MSTGKGALLRLLDSSSYIPWAHMGYIMLGLGLRAQGFEVSDVGNSSGLYKNCAYFYDAQVNYEMLVLSVQVRS